MHPKSSSDNANVLDSIKDLPKDGYVLTPADLKDVPLNSDFSADVAVWCNIGKGVELPIGGIPITLIVSNVFKNDIGFFSYRKALRKTFHVEKVCIARKELISSIRESGKVAASENAVMSEDNELYTYFQSMIRTGMRDKVSDVHIERRRHTALIRMRKHGQLVPHEEIPSEFCRQVCSVIYNVLAENKEINFQPRDYQSASVNHRIDGEEIKLRYQSLPSYPDECFDVVMRLLPLKEEEGGAPDMSTLGYSPNQVDEMFSIVSRPVGALVIAGTTGSGKSTTLKNLLMLINESRHFLCKIYTIEDPPEYKIPRVTQIPVVRQKGEDYSIVSPFEAPLLAAMRGDPDILMIGEIRDKYTGDGMKKATQSGHQVLTTIHASSALGSCERLSDFGITPNVMGSPEFINGLIYQKLIPVLCNECSSSFKDLLKSPNASKADKDLKNRLDEILDGDSDAVDLRVKCLKERNDCLVCKGLGVIGRTVCAEIVVPDFTMLGLFREQKSIEAKAYWRSWSDGDVNSQNMKGKTVLEHAIFKMKDGSLSPYDIEELLGHINSAKTTLEQMEKDPQTSKYFRK